MGATNGDWRVGPHLRGLSSQWLHDAKCVHEAEGGWYANTGNGYEGGMQFTPGTWQHARSLALVKRHLSFPEHAYDAQPWQQLWAARMIWEDDGGSWEEWGTAGRCGLS